ncbi:hypothetical protein TRFO_38252 [Tritrichomonas foetus]|uniref:Intimal thickness related receptor IRP domain-containing protein n=1 Tax=Tritrichomonas foetus TaxID=1144522 RepID=A0A1J4J8W2_9EUKA|nr:hypothetical protein TRFO_38252 [Tritrichomonas foetus]|eukprot:OHS95626.1 hypothetical protein TRFO_38252 [Tritrichomonas foetus]
MIFFIFSLFFRTSLKLTDSEIHRFGRYNFGIDGEFSFIAKSDVDQFVMVSLFDEHQIPTLEAFESDKRNLCNVVTENNSAIHQIIQIVNGTALFSGTFDESHVIIAAASSCNSTIMDTVENSEVIIQAIFKNKNLYLSTDVYPVLFMKPVLAVFYLILLIVWIIKRQKNAYSLFIFTMMTLTLIFFFIDNLIYFLLLWYTSKSDNPTFFTYIRYVTRALSVMLFFATIVLSAFAVSRDGKRLHRDNIIASFATGIFIAIPVTFVEEVNKTDSELWVNFFASVFLFICWGVSFSMLFKAWNPVFEKFQALKNEGNDLQSLTQTPLGKQYRALNMHTILYAIVLFTSIVYTLLPYPMKYSFVLSQFILDFSMFFELLTSILFFWILKIVFGVDEKDIANVTSSAPPISTPDIRTELIGNNNDDFHGGFGSNTREMPLEEIPVNK